MTSKPHSIRQPDLKMASAIFTPIHHCHRSHCRNCGSAQWSGDALRSKMSRPRHGAQHVYDMWVICSHQEKQRSEIVLMAHLHSAVVNLTQGTARLESMFSAEC